MKLNNLINDRLILVSILSLILISLIVIFRPDIDDSKNKYKSFWLKKTFADSQFNIILMGDSRVYRGLAPQIFEKIIPNSKVLNFGYSSGRFNNYMYRKAEEKLSNNNVQKIIILGISPNALTSQDNENGHILDFINMPREEKYEILYYYDYLKYFEPIRKENFKKKTESNYSQEYMPHGWIASDYEKEDTLSAIPSYKKWFTKNNVSPQLLKDLFKQVKKWTDAGIQVDAFRVPTSYTMKKLEDSLSGFNQATFISLIKRNGGNWIKINNNEYHSYDGSHLEKASAIKLSKKVAEQVLQLSN